MAAILLLQVEIAASSVPQHSKDCLCKSSTLQTASSSCRFADGAADADRCTKHRKGMPWLGMPWLLELPVQ